MMQRQKWLRLAVVGAEAVGGYFRSLIARAGAPVVMIGRKSFIEAVKTKGIFLDTLNFKEYVRVEASTQLKAAVGADIEVFCVKTSDATVTARELAPFLTPNQVQATAKITAFQAVVYVAASVPELGHVKHVGRGDLVIGPESEEFAILVEMLARAQIPCRISNNIEDELWTELIWNCALNAISALGRARYRRIAEGTDAGKLMETVIHEVLAVARAAHLVLRVLQRRCVVLHQGISRDTSHDATALARKPRPGLSPLLCTT